MLQEHLLVCSAAPATAKAEQPSTPTCTLTDLHTGARANVYRDNRAGPGATAWSSVHELIFAAQSDRPIVHVYARDREAPLHRHIVPERLNVLACDPRGAFLAGGTASGRLFLWELGSGSLRMVREAAHFQAVTGLRFMSEGAHLVSWSLDGAAHMWNVAQCCAGGDPVPPFYSYERRAAPVLDVYVSPARRGRAYVLMGDKRVDIVELGSRALLATVMMPEECSCLAIDPLERHMLVGGVSGVIYRTELYARYPQGTGNDVTGALSGLVTRSGPDTTTQQTFAGGHRASVTALVLSMDGETLVSGDSEGQVVLWSIASRQPTSVVQGGAGVLGLLVFTSSTGVHRKETAPLPALDRVLQATPASKETLLLCRPGHESERSGPLVEEAIARGRDSLLRMDDAGTEETEGGQELRRQLEEKERQLGEKDAELKQLYTLYNRLSSLYKAAVPE